MDPNDNNSTSYVTEIPSYLKELARLISCAFYQVEDSLIVDALVRHPCMKEKDIEELLKFDLKLIRSRMATLKAEKFVQARLRMETGIDGKAQKVIYHFINYKSLVNVIKYKLDHMRKKMETQERDLTNRASFKCTNCAKTFTDLEAGELFDPVSMSFLCTFCKQLVEEDESVPKTDSRLMLARFNEQMEHIFELLRKAEKIKLAPELLEPEPPRLVGDIGNETRTQNEHGIWSGEATRLRGINDQTRIDIRIGDAAVNKSAAEKKELPSWLTDSGIGGYSYSNPNSMSDTIPSSDTPGGSANERNSSKEDIMSYLLQFESTANSKQKQTNAFGVEESDSDSDNPDNIPLSNHQYGLSNGGMNSSGSSMHIDQVKDSSSVPLVQVGTTKMRITEIDEEVIERMSIPEKEAYITQYQEYYANAFD